MLKDELRKKKSHTYIFLKFLVVTNFWAEISYPQKFKKETLKMASFLFAISKIEERLD